MARCRFPVEKVIARIEGVLADADGPMSGPELAERVGMSASWVHQAIKRAKVRGTIVSVARRGYRIAS